MNTYTYISMLRKNISLLLFAVILVWAAVANVNAQSCPEPAGSESIVNGGFESGYTGHSFGNHLLHNDVIGECPDCLANDGKICTAPNYYYVGSSVADFCEYLDGNGQNGFPVITPHSGNNMLMIDGSTLQNQVAWEQTINVIPNQKYYLSNYTNNYLFYSQLNQSLNLNLMTKLS